MRKTILIVCVTAALMLAMCGAALAEGANEWSQYQKDAGHAGTIDVGLPTTNRIAHSSENISAVDGSQPVVAGNKAYVYAGVPGVSGAIYCYDLTSGAKLWNTAVAPDSSNVSMSSPAVAAGVVYIGSGSKVQALDAASGKLLWTKDLTTIKASADVVNSSPAVDGDRLIIGDFFNGCYYCLDVSQGGKPLWTFTMDAGSMAMSTACIDGGLVYVGQQGPFGTANGKVWCLDETTGKAVTAWGTHGSYSTVGKLDVDGTVTAYGDFIYFTDFTYDSTKSCHLYCLSKNTGAEAWKVVAAGSDGAPAVTDGLVVTAGEQYGVSNFVTAFSANTDTGKNPVLRWKKSGIGGYVMSACIADGQVAVGNGLSGWPPFAATDVSVLSASDGSTMWHSTEAGGPPVATPYGLLSVADGKLTVFGSGALPAGDFYFAEGTTRPGYQEWLCLENPTGAKVTTAIEYMMTDGSTRKQAVALPKQSRTTVDVNAFVGAGKDVSARITGDGYFVAERSVYFSANGINGGEQVMGATSPGQHFLYAEGTTRDGFKTWLAVQNPQAAEANVLITYLYADGTPPVQQNLRVGAKTRQTVDVNAGAGADKDVSISVSANKPVVSERVMYFTYPSMIAGSHPSGVHNSTGAGSAGTNWYFAEGATYGNFAEYLCLMNPRGKDTTATISYMKGTGTARTVTKLLKANSRTTVDVNADVGPDQDVSAQVTAPDPIVAERPMYFMYSPVAINPTVGAGQEAWKGGHDTAGAPYEAYKWEFAEGCTRSGFQTYLCMANPNDVTAKVGITYYTYLPDGTSKAIKDVSSIAPHARRTILVNQVIGAGADVSETVTSQVPIVVERPMYFSNSGCTDGGVSLGLPGSP